MSNWHLILLMQGLAGNSTQPSTIDLLAEDICALIVAHGETRTAVAVIHSGTGPITTQGQQAADEVVQLVENHLEQGRHFADFSVIGHSLGGLVARVMAKRLGEVMPKLAPRTYVSLFTPHAGLPQPVEEQLNFMFSTGTRDDNGLRELLDLSSDGLLQRTTNFAYREALLRFSKRVLVGALNDWLLDYESATLYSAEAPEPNSSGVGALNLRTVHHGALPCKQGLPRSAVLCELADVPFRRVGVEWSLTQPGKMELQVMSQVERMELLRDLLPDLTLHETLSRGQQCENSIFRCSPGLTCKEGACYSSAFAPAEICKSTSPAVCSTAVNLITEVLQDWHLIVTSSGGGGHIAAAENLRKILSQDMQDRYTRALNMLHLHKGALQLGAFSQLHSALQGLKAQTSRVEVVDIMKSNCVSIDGKGKFFMGDWMASQWNEKQQKGDISGLKQLIELQPLTQVLLGRQCTEVLEDYMTGEPLGYQKPPTGLHSTQPLFMKSLSHAAEKIGVPTLNVYATDLPTPACVHFFKPLRAFVRTGRADKVVLHSIPPVRGVVELMRLSGLPKEQIALEKYMPVDPRFVLDELPSPGQSTGILLQAQLLEETAFLRSLGNPIVVAERDEVLLIMLGSQPPISAVREYADSVRNLPRPSRRRFIFIACGDHTIGNYSSLYRDLATDAKRYNGASTIVVPFTGQDAKAIFGRASSVVVRASGMTSGEILALRSRRTDDKRVFLHAASVSPEAMERTENKVKFGFANWDDMAQGLSVWAMAALDEGMVPWEAGNARFLMNRVGATLVTASKLVTMWTNTTSLHVGKDVQSFLLGEQPAACAKLACAREAAPVSSREFAQGKQSCEVALGVFEGAERDVVLNSHRCGRTVFVVRHARDAEPSFLRFGTSADRAAAGVASACGGTVMSCGDYVAVAVKDDL